MTPPPVYLITGAMAAGKSSVAQAVAERLPRSAHVRGDVFRRMIVSGRVEMTPDAGEDAWAQLRLRYRLAAGAAHAYRAAGFTPVVQDVILGHFLAEAAALYGDVDLRLTVLQPAPDVVAERDRLRHKHAYGAYTPADLHRILQEDTPRLGYWLDSSALTVGETAQAILDHPWP